MKYILAFIFLVLTLSTSLSYAVTAPTELLASMSAQSSQLTEAQQDEHILIELEKINAILDMRKIIWITESTIFIFFFITLIFVISYNHKQNKNKNLSIVRQIQEMQQIVSSNKSFHFNFLYDNNKNESGINTNSEDALFSSLQQLMSKERLYLKPNLTKEDIIERLQTNKNSLTESLKRELNSGSFSDYIASLRISESIFLLENYPEYTIEEIAEKVGFRTRRTFYRQFQKKFDVSPAEYRKLFS